MPTIKDALDIINKLTVKEQENLKTILLSTSFAKSLSIEELVTKERFTNGRVCSHCGGTHVARNGRRSDGTQRYICKDCGKSFVIRQTQSHLVPIKICPFGKSTLIV